LCRGWGKRLRSYDENGCLIEYVSLSAVPFPKTEQIDAMDATQYSFGEGKNVQRCEDEMKLFREMISEKDDLAQQVRVALEINANSTLRYDYAEYNLILDEVIEIFEKYDGTVLYDDFARKCSPLIQRVKYKHKDIKKEIFRIMSGRNNQSSREKRQFTFFAGGT